MTEFFGKTTELFLNGSTESESWHYLAWPNEQITHLLKDIQLIHVWILCSIFNCFMPFSSESYVKICNLSKLIGTRPLW